MITLPIAQTPGARECSSRSESAASWRRPAFWTRFHVVRTLFLAATLILPLGDASGVLKAQQPPSTGVTTRVSVATDGAQGNGLSYVPTISADGRYVAFQSQATNLVAGDTNGVGDAFVHDRVTGVTTRVSVATDGTRGNQESSIPAISADGRHVAFLSYASNLAKLRLKPPSEIHAGLR